MSRSDHSPLGIVDLATFVPWIHLWMAHVESVSVTIGMQFSAALAWSVLFKRTNVYSLVAFALLFGAVIREAFGRPSIAQRAITKSRRFCPRSRG